MLRGLGGPLGKELRAVGAPGCPRNEKLGLTKAEGCGSKAWHEMIEGATL